MRRPFAGGQRRTLSPHSTKPDGFGVGRGVHRVCAARPKDPALHVSRRRRSRRAEAMRVRPAIPSAEKSAWRRAAVAKTSLKRLDASMLFAERDRDGIRHKPREPRDASLAEASHAEGGAVGASDPRHHRVPTVPPDRATRRRAPDRISSRFHRHARGTLRTHAGSDLAFCFRLQRCIDSRSTRSGARSCTFFTVSPCRRPECPVRTVSATAERSELNSTSSGPVTSFRPEGNHPRCTRRAPDHEPRSD
jgi:hypothetical protein